jgi:diadenosine tetraphosphate (Ap4A) HIT family hydrolase
VTGLAQRCVLCQQEHQHQVAHHGEVRAWMPTAPLADGEVRLAPTAHTGMPTPRQADSLAVLLAATVRGFAAVWGPVAYNLVLHIERHRGFHWHAHLLPWPSRWGALAVGYGVVGVASPPERVADVLRDATQEQVDRLEI